MSILNRLTVAQRLAVGFGLLTVLLLGVCALGAYNARGAQQMINVEVTAIQQRIDLSYNLVALQQTRDLNIRQIGLLTDVSEMQNQAKSAHASSERIATLLKQLIEHDGTGEERELLTAVQDLDTRYKPVAEKAISMAMSVLNEEAAKIITTQLDALSVQQRQKVERYAELQHRRSDQARERMTADASRATWLMLAAAMLGLLCAVVGGWIVSRSVTGPLRQAVELADQVADGNLTVRLSSDSHDEIGVLIRSLDRMAARLREVIGTMHSSSESMLTASSEIASGNQDLSMRTEQQAAALQKTTSAIEQMTQSVRGNADSARQAAQLASQASREAGEGGDRVSEVVSTMDAISQSSRKISDIVGVIDGIAFQTNILALNAAVEAARAGEQGRGFAVVASEVRSLAQRSATAAREIKSLIASNVEKVEQGSQLVGAAGRTVSGVVATASRVASLITEISGATDEQAIGLQQVSEAVTSIDHSTQQNAALVEQSAAAAESLKEQAHQLNAAVSNFQIGRSAVAA